ncbi:MULTISPECIES: ParB/RepB/Spo0J family partition protein [unclassified Desulfovibrio]|uniref:ParB/RepB/Spo0J family partition protein n=1 Tax=unclassified Desulfovibrio TaxID=2593640 RepID=UPI0013EBF624|nr:MULTISPECIES: ParB/RepB/Spo0J family partition protein [unclassified Desulfovibrio]
MATNARGLGRGLDALFEGSAQQRTPAEPPRTLPLTALVANPAQPRRTFTEEALAELADSIRQQGIIQPLLVRPLEGGERFQIVAGERRWRAAEKAGLSEVPVYVRAMDEQEAMAAALIENLQREDLNPVEEAEALNALRTTLGITQEELAARLGRSRPAVANALRLLQLGEAALADLREGRISAGHGRCLVGVGPGEAAEALRQRIILTGMTVREAEEAVAHLRDTGAYPWEAVAEDSAGKERKSAAARKPLAQPLEDLRERLSSALDRQVRISGTQRKGRITFAYTSPEDLATLLARLGLDRQEAG